MKKECLVCEKEYSRKPKEWFSDWAGRKFCSTKCGYIGRSVHKGIPRTEETKKKISETKLANPNRFGENASNWKNKRIICPDCGERASYGSKKRCRGCSLKYQKKENHPRWKNGISLVAGYTSQQARKRFIKKLGNGGSHTIFEWETLKAQYNWTCLACSKMEPEIKLSQDHIIPISKGGSDNIENIQPLCRPCNSKKHTKITNYR